MGGTCLGGAALLRLPNKSAPILQSWAHTSPWHTVFVACINQQRPCGNSCSLGLCPPSGHIPRATGPDRGSAGAPSCQAAQSQCMSKRTNMRTSSNTLFPRTRTHTVAELEGLQGSPAQPAHFPDEEADGSLYKDRPLRFLSNRVLCSAPPHRSLLLSLSPISGGYSPWKYRHRGQGGVQPAAPP